MKILFLVPAYPNSASDYTGKFFRDQARALHGLGHQVGVIVAPTLLGKRQLRKIRSLSDLKIKIQRLDDHGIPIIRSKGWGWFPGFLPQANLELKVQITRQTYQQYCQQYGTPDILHAQTCLPAGYLAARVLEKNNQTLVITEHSTAFLRKLIPSFMNRPVNKALRRAGKVIAVGQKLAEKLQQVAPELEVCVLGNIVDESFFQNKLELPPLPPFIFCLVAVLKPNKRVDLLLRAFAHVFSGQQVQLRVGGDGPELSRLEALSRSLGINEQVQFLGRLDGTGVRQLLQTSHALVSTSDYETFGLTAAEAMACGRPVIATRSGGPEDFITEETGLIVPVDDSEALSFAMQQIQTHYAQYDPQTIRQTCQNQFSARMIAQHLEQIYRELVREAGNA